MAGEKSAKKPRKGKDRQKQAGGGRPIPIDGSGGGDPPNAPETPVSEEPLFPGEAPKPRKLVVRIAIYFDGTGNNATNTASFIPFFDPLNVFGVSYLSDYTNVWRLYVHHRGYKPGVPGAENWTKFYVPGIGTSPYKLDDPSDLALGIGDTGITSKANEALALAVAHIANLATKEDTVDVYFDVFGFSRGAATARHFIYRALPAGDDEVRKILKKNYDITVTKVEAVFAGLFDTVSAFGKNKSDDVAQLKLDAVRWVTGHAYHICAADEYRRFYALTDIRSAITAGVGTEIFLPGAHADIGGGYPDNSAEITCTISKVSKKTAEKDKKFLVDTKGFYQDFEVFTIPPNAKSFRNVASRQGIRNSYAYVSLAFMRRAAERQGMIFDVAAMNAQYPVVGKALLTAAGTMQKYVDRVEAAEPAVKPNAAMVDWVLDPDRPTSLPPSFRRLYCHYSANEYTIPGETRWSPKSEAIRKRQVISG